MQRIACLAAAVLLFAAGCAENTQRSNTAPSPLLATRSAPPRYVPPPPLPPLPAPRPAPQPAPKPAPPPAVKPAPIGNLIDPVALRPTSRLDRNRWKVIVVHHSANNNDTPEGMHRYHLENRGWANGLGYHFVIGNGIGYPDGKIYPGPRWKRQQVGAHCKAGPGRYFGVFRGNNYFNDHGVGICLIGNFDGTPPTPRQLAALEQLIAYLCGDLKIDPRLVYGHGQVTGKTACPGRNLSGNLSAIRTRVSRTVAASLDADPGTDAAWALPYALSESAELAAMPLLIPGAGAFADWTPLAALADAGGVMGYDAFESAAVGDAGSGHLSHGPGCACPADGMEPAVGVACELDAQDDYTKWFAAWP